MSYILLHCELFDEEGKGIREWVVYDVSVCVSLARCVICGCQYVSERTKVCVICVLVFEM